MHRATLTRYLVLEIRVLCESWTCRYGKIMSTVSIHERARFCYTNPQNPTFFLSISRHIWSLVLEIRVFRASWTCRCGKNHVYCCNLRTSSFLLYWSSKSYIFIYIYAHTWYLVLQIRVFMGELNLQVWENHVYCCNSRTRGFSLYMISQLELSSVLVWSPSMAAPLSFRFGIL